MGWPRFAALALVLCLGWAPLPRAHGADTAQAAPPATADALDEAVEQLRSDIWMLYGGTAYLGQDGRGRTISDDLRDYVLAPPQEQRLRELLTLVRVGGEPGTNAADALAEAGRILAAE